MRAPRSQLLTSVWVAAACCLPLFGDLLHMAPTTCLAYSVSEDEPSARIGEAATAVAENHMAVVGVAATTKSADGVGADSVDPIALSPSPVMVQAAAPADTPSPTPVSAIESSEVGGEADCDDSLDVLDAKDCDDELDVAEPGADCDDELELALSGESEGEIGAEAKVEAGAGGATYGGANWRSSGRSHKKKHGNGNWNHHRHDNNDNSQTQIPPNSDQDNHQGDDPDCAFPIAKESDDTSTTWSDGVGGEGDAATVDPANERDPDCDEKLPYAYDDSTSPHSPFPLPQVGGEPDCEDELEIPGGGDKGDADDNGGRHTADDDDCGDALEVAGGDNGGGNQQSHDKQKFNRWGKFGHAGRGAHGSESYSFSSQVSQEKSGTDLSGGESDVAASVVPYPGE